jgi:beta-lactamase regulating signal transducer with metallopeptidase domain
MIAHLWQSTWFAVGVALLTLAFRGNRARVRYWLWLCASMKFLIPFAPLVSVGGLLATRRAVIPDTPVVIERIAVSLAEPAMLTMPAAQAHRNVDWTPALSAIWFVGFGIITIIRLRGWWRVRAALRASTPMPLNVPVEVRATPGLLEPGVVGLLRPVLLVPCNIEERLTPAQLSAVLAHELCHVRRRDNLFAAIHMLVEAAFWFHPMVWWIGARMVEERERACDEGVLSLGGEPRDYAEAILNVCKLYVEYPLACVSGVTGANLKTRIEAIMNNRIGRGLNLSKKLVLTAAATAAVAIPVLIGAAIAQRVMLHIARAQPPQAQTPRPAPHNSDTQVVWAPQRTQAAPAPQAQGRRIAMLFDRGALTAEEQTRAQEAAVRYVREHLIPSDAVTIMQSDGSRVTVVQDFTNNPALLESAILGITPANGSVTPDTAAALEQSARMLGVMHGKKTLMYFAGGARFALDEAARARAVQAAVQNEVAFYPIDTRGIVQDELIYQGVPVAVTTRGSVFTGDSQFPVNLAIIAGLPGKHASIRTSRASDAARLSVPLDELTGRIEIVAQIANERGEAVANLRDSVDGGAEYQANFKLAPGRYRAGLTVQVRSTGKQYAESIQFEVR